MNGHADDSKRDASERPPAAGDLPLAGIRCIDVATVIAALTCASILGEFGAEVLKVEHPVGGDACRNFGTPTSRGDTLTWLSEARNKKSVTIDLHSPDGAPVQGARRADGHCLRELPPGHARKMGARVGCAARDQPEAHHAEGFGLRANGPL